MRLLRAVPVVLFASALSAPVLAAPADHAAAVESFRRGTQLVEAGRLQDAVDAFREALQYEPASVGARLDLADCYEKIGAPAQAWRQYAIAEAYARKANDARTTMARTSSAALEARLLVVRMVGRGSPAMELRVDGDLVEEEIVERGSLALAPGHHRAELTDPGKKAIALELAGGAGETRALPIAFEAEAPSLPPERAPSSAPPRASGSSGSPQRTWGLVLGGVGLAAAGAGAVLGGIAVTKKSSLESEATDPALGSARFYSDRSSADTVAGASTACLIAGGVAFAAGVALVIAAQARRDGESGGNGGAWVRVGPSVGSGAGGIVVAGGF